MTAFPSGQCPALELQMRSHPRASDEPLPCRRFISAAVLPFVRKVRPGFAGQRREIRSLRSPPEPEPFWTMRRQGGDHARTGMTGAGGSAQADREFRRKARSKFEHENENEHEHENKNEHENGQDQDPAPAQTAGEMNSGRIRRKRRQKPGSAPDLDQNRIFQEHCRIRQVPEKERGSDA